MFDALTARAVAEELHETLARGRVQEIVALDALTIGFEIYVRHARHYLLASAAPSASRIHLVAAKLRASGEPPTPFLLLLKKHARNAFVNRVEAAPRERIVRIEFDHAAEGIATLVCESMGRHANLILLDAAGVVLDALKRVTPAMSRVRAVLPKTVYVPPPPQNKADPLALDLPQLARLLAAQRGEPLWQVLVQNIAGTSPLLARELAFRVARRADAVCEPTCALELHAQLERSWRAPPEPTLAFADEQSSAVAAFALTHLTPTRRAASMSAALETFYGAVESYAALKETVRGQIEDARARLAQKRAALGRAMVAPEQVERLKTNGELILAYAHTLAPRQKVLRAEFGEGAPLEIALEPTLSPVENAQQYFAQYRRAKAAAAQVPARLQEVAADLAFAEQVLADLDGAETRVEIEAVQAEAHAAGLIKAERRSKGKKGAPGIGPRVFVSPDGFEVWVGRNARQNEEITFARARGQDWWLHARDVAGAHVVILGQGRAAPPPPPTIQFAAGLAAFYSQARGETWVDVVVTPRKNVRRVAGRAARPGLVTVRAERVLRVQPTPPST